MLIVHGNVNESKDANDIHDFVLDDGRFRPLAK